MTTLFRIASIGLFAFIATACSPAGSADLNDSLQSPPTLDNMSYEVQPMAPEPTSCACSRTKCDAQIAPSCSITCEAPKKAQCNCADCSTYSTFNMCRCI